MNALRRIAAELIGLFLDDVFLAVATLAVVVIAALASVLLHQPLLAGVILVIGCIGALVLSAVRTK